MLRRKDDFSYSPGILAKKMGVHTNTVKAHLRKTGLIKQCYRDDDGWLRIPQSVALKFCSAETLAIPLKHKAKKGRAKIDDNPGSLHLRVKMHSKGFA